jgi:sulfite exporter TauE/SafE
MISILAGFLAGLIHVFSGPDHLAAITPLAVRSHRRACVAGFRWGLGHAAGVLFVGMLSLLLRGLLPVDLISSWSERLVGLLLIGIGIWSWHKALHTRIHAHEHSHGGASHLHFHVHAAGNVRDGNHERKPHVHGHAAFAIGTLHGLAGSSHFLGILPALAFASNRQAAGYLIAFGVGTVAAMLLFSSIIGLLATRFAVGGTRAYRGLMYVCSVAAVAVGVAWLVV